MGDSNDIERIFQHDLTLPKYQAKRWIIVPDSNNGNYNSCSHITAKNTKIS